MKREDTCRVSSLEVIPLRLERRTYCLEGSCSIQLSYGTISKTSARKFIFEAESRNGRGCGADATFPF